MTSGGDVGAGARSGWWRDGVWPVLVGLLTTVGTLELGRGHGLAGLVLAPASIWIVSSLLVFGALCDLGCSFVWSLRAGLAATVVIVAVLGSLSLFPRVGATASCFLAATSPWALDVLARRTRRASPREAGALSEDRVEQSFAEIVEALERDTSWPDG